MLLSLNLLIRVFSSITIFCNFVMQFLAKLYLTNISQCSCLLGRGDRVTASTYRSTHSSGCNSICLLGLSHLVVHFELLPCYAAEKAMGHFSRLIYCCSAHFCILCYETQPGVSKLVGLHKDKWFPFRLNSFKNEFRRGCFEA